MIHIHIDSYDREGRPLGMRLELDDKLRPLVVKLLENLVEGSEKQEITHHEEQISAPF